jgi:hypothetical protein
MAIAIFLVECLGFSIVVVVGVLSVLQDMFVRGPYHPPSVVDMDTRRGNE